MGQIHADFAIVVMTCVTVVLAFVAIVVVVAESSERRRQGRINLVVRQNAKEIAYYRNLVRELWGVRKTLQMYGNEAAYTRPSGEDMRETAYGLAYAILISFQDEQIQACARRIMRSSAGSPFDYIDKNNAVDESLGHIARVIKDLQVRQEEVINAE